MVGLVTRTKCFVVRSLLALSALACSLSFSRDAFAQGEQSELARGEAEERYRRALELFEEGSYDASLLEFRRAYELVPSYRILYNIALVNVQMNDYAAAISAFERFLEEGSDKIDEARRGEVQAMIEPLHSKVGYLEIEVNQVDATVLVDEQPVGTSPLADPLRVNGGRRRITVTWNDQRKTQVAEVAGGDRLQFVFTFENAEPASQQIAPQEHAPQKNYTPVYVSWGVTGALAASSAVVGALALGAKSNLTDEQERLGVTPSELDSAAKKVNSLALTTDILIGAAVASAGVALYFTLRKPAAENSSHAPRSTFSLGLSLQGASIRGSF